MKSPVSSLDAAAETLAAALKLVADRPLLVVTGAGISLASGIPTFRGSDPDAVWAKDVVELGTFDFFRRDPVASWRWYLERFDGVARAKPNPGHLALAELEARRRDAGGGATLLVTQNVDTLHRQAGSQTLVEIHGRADRVRCSREGCEHGAPAGSLPRTDFDIAAFRASPSDETLPVCPACGSTMRQHVLWFDEYYQSHQDYQFERAVRAAEEADLFLFVGTSFSVGITEILLGAAYRRGAAILVVDPATASALPGARLLCVAAEELLPAALERLPA